MNKSLRYLFACLLLALGLSQPAAAQAPGWAWVKTHTSTGYPVLGENRAAGVGRDAAGNIYTAGGYTDIPAFSGQATTNLGGSEAFLAKYDPAGNLLWLKALHGAAADAATTLIVLPSGRCLVSGYFGAGPGGGNLSFAEFGSSLVLPGAQQLGLVPATLVGPTGQPVYHPTPFLMAVEPDGVLAWAINPSPTNRVEPKELACDPQGNIYLAATSYYGLSLNGTAYPAIGNSDAVLLKYNASGQWQWVRRVGRANQTIGSEAVKVDNSGSAYLMVNHSAGFVLGTLNVPYGGGSTIVKVSPTNQVKWAKNSLVLLSGQPVYLTMPGFDPAGALYLALSSPNSGNLTFSGPGSPLTPPNSNPNIYTSYVIKCDTAAQVSWVKPVAGAIAATGTYSGVYDIQRLLPSTNGFTALTYTVESGQSTFVGSPVTYGAADGGLVCVLRYNTSTDQVEWVRTGGTAYGASSSNSRAGTNVRGAVLDPTGNVYIAGEYYGPAQFGAVNLGLTGGQRSSYLAKLDQTVLPAKAAVAGKAWRVYPNPATSVVQLEDLPARATVRVLDALGREVRSTAAATLDLNGLAPGLYLLQAVGTPEPYKPQRLLVE